MGNLKTGIHDSVRTPEALLMEGVARQDMKSLELVIRRFRPLVFRTALRIVCSTDEAEDITQETFIRVWRHAGRYDSRYSIRTWLYRIASNLALDHLRRRRLFRIRLPDVITGRAGNAGIPEEKSAEEKLIMDEDWKAFIRISEKLSPKQRLVLTLRDIEGLDTEQVAEITGMSADQIKSNLFQARRKVKDMLDRKRHIPTRK